ncbi:hypothetical protein OTU49_003537 [Cherax quadricarinatus]|uniref:Protein DEK n=1 Tax=Cherax quadricarinatus TaxID=27406 RepID=A0AAW0XGX7_CHEQU
MSDEETKKPLKETADEEMKEVEDAKDVKAEKPETKEKQTDDEEEETKEEKKDEASKKGEVDEEEGEEEETEEKEKKERKERKRENVTKTPKKENEIPLYDQPLEMSGKRDRKKVERFVQEAKKEEVEPTGTGEALGDIPFIESMISKMSADELKVLHRVAYSRPGSSNEIKKNLRKFNGFPFTKEDKKYQSKLSIVERIVMSEIKKMLMILGLERSGNKAEAVERLMAFMLEPHDTGKKPQISGKRAKGRGRPKKGQEKKRENNTSMNDSESGGNESNESNLDEREEEVDEEEEEIVDEEDEEVEEEEEEEEKPKRTPARKTPAKKAPSKRATSAKKAAPVRRSRAAESDDSDSDDEPLAKKVKQPPSDAELKIMVKKILEGANLEEVTMKSVCRQVYDNYPDFDLTHKKVFIKETVKSIIS